MPYILAQTVGGIEIPYTALTIIFIILATGVGVFVRKRSRDSSVPSVSLKLCMLRRTDSVRTPREKPETKAAMKPLPPIADSASTPVTAPSPGLRPQGLTRARRGG